MTRLCDFIRSAAIRQSAIHKFANLARPFSGRTEPDRQLLRSSRAHRSLNGGERNSGKITEFSTETASSARGLTVGKACRQTNVNDIQLAFFAKWRGKSFLSTRCRWGSPVLDSSDWLIISSLLFALFPNSETDDSRKRCGMSVRRWTIFENPQSSDKFVDDRAH